MKPGWQERGPFLGRLGQARQFPLPPRREARAPRDRATAVVAGQRLRPGPGEHVTRASRDGPVGFLGRRGAEGCVQARGPSGGPAASASPACARRAGAARPRAQRPPEVTPAASGRACPTPRAAAAAVRRRGRPSPRPGRGCGCCCAARDRWVGRGGCRGPVGPGPARSVRRAAAPPAVGPPARAPGRPWSRAAEAVGRRGPRAAGGESRRSRPAGLRDLGPVGPRPGLSFRICKMTARPR